MAVVVPEKDFYSLHGIWGAYASLVIGRFNKGAGLVVGNVQPPQRALFVGYQYGNAIPRLLPFCPSIKVGLGVEAYVDPDAPARPALEVPRYILFTEEEIQRQVSYSGERWDAGQLSMEITSFFGTVPNPANTETQVLQKHLCPAIYVTLIFDNQRGKEEMRGIFGMQGIRRPLSDSTGGNLLGFAQGTSWGFATVPSEAVEEAMDWQVLEAVFNGRRPLRRLASEGALRFTVKPGEKKTFIIALGVYRDGIVTAGKPMYAYYTSLFRDLEEVLQYALRHSQEALDRAHKLDMELDRSSLSEDRKFLLSHAAHSYCANTELLLSETGDPYFLVNEGEYQMMNTLDLTVDQAFFELIYSPWTVGLELEAFLERSLYRDSYGIAFTHDQGVADCFSPVGTSSYELPNLSECFSYMTYEETANWLLTACLYIHNTNNRPWFEKHQEYVRGAIQSILARDANKDGIMDIDSDRCGRGSEITTYDSLDASLGQARNNLYLAVKAWGALICGAEILKRYGDANKENALIQEISQQAQAAATTIASRFIAEEGYIPAVFENNNQSRIIPAVEGLIYPYIIDAKEAVSEKGPFRPFITTLKKHLSTVLKEGLCLDSTSGGWKLSSTSKNTWLSKIFINQFVAERILGFSGEKIERDGIHARWLRTSSAQWAATDQVESSSGKDLGSRLYPRLVTAILWLKY
ncbi:MAG TPA: glycoside hydrolase family 52 protein [Termitinemataceae bacterium]|nr:glycoside hydrolase family 52 protein [Termitinemataceae bacterium]HOM23498.1 glycoside hydrolase family 52 protein [Termitinemataceae bacterium]HPP99987.1 glycoside hydrolase family 52 protein [Termitinemataceae bacterium]